MSGHEFPVPLRGAKAETLLWAHEHEVESAALNQLRNIAALPWVHGVRVMPDVHLGKGATVGSVIAMEQAVSPNAVGVDIGCGVNAVRTSLTASDLERLPALRAAIERAVPVGFKSHEDAVGTRALLAIGGPKLVAQAQRLRDSFGRLHEGVQDRAGNAGRQLGTLGGGNHFIELCLDAEDRVWITLHSGSRNIGKELAERHVAIARELPHNAELPDRDLAVFLRGTPEMDAYRRDLYWAQDYAMASRTIMLGLVKRVVSEHFPELAVSYDAEINCHHNYVSEETVDGRDMLVTRKGAIRAGAGDLALIPGSMGTGSYVVRGLGNPASFQSASHGAGRKMSRGAAKRTFTVEDLKAQTAGIESRKDEGVVDEIPGAYKDIHSVIEAQRDLVDVVQHLRTVLCVKG